MRKILVGIVLCMVLAGCKTTEVEGEKTYSLDPNTTVVAESVAETGVAIGGLLSGFFPFLTPIVGAGAGILATWRKLKPELEKEKTRSEIAELGGRTLAEVLDEIKRTNPEAWKIIGPKIADATKTVSDVENAIRGFRNLPPR